MLAGLAALALLAAARVAFSTSDDLPPGDAQTGKAVFQQYCLACHGAAGKGDGPAAAALNPKPANFSDHDRMSKVPESRRIQTVHDGGASVGLSSAMPPFGDTLTDQQILDVLAYVRTELIHP